MRMTRLSTVPAVFLLLISAVMFFSRCEAAEEQWKYLGANEKGEQFFYDAASVMHISRDEVRVWTRELSRSAPVRRLKEVNCSFKVARDLQVSIERPDSVPDPRNRNADWRAMENDPAMRKLMKAVCR